MSIVGWRDQIALPCLAADQTPSYALLSDVYWPASVAWSASSPGEVDFADPERTFYLLMLGLLTLAWTPEAINFHAATVGDEVGGFDSGEYDWAEGTPA